MERTVIGGGCFWCIEGVFKAMNGVQSALPGYAGGKDENTTYGEVCDGGTGHAEVVEIIFDPVVISYRTILEVFFTVHDPTQLNRQGNDIGTQYRSVIFHLNEEQKAIAESVMAEFENSFEDPIVTELSPLTTYCEAEEYHHDYFARNPGNQYCQMVVSPKLAKYRQKLSHLY